VGRLEHLRYIDKGTYTANLEELGFQLTSSLKYTELFIEVHQDAKGWSYMAFAMPLHRKTSDAGGWGVAQYADAKSRRAYQVHSPVSRHLAASGEGGDPWRGAYRG
jgi:hypothetical protein